jgi:hypothetical protein
VHKFILVICIIILGNTNGFGQEVSTKGQFIQDSLLIGETVNFSLTASYPKGMDIIFPDSTHRFSTFEYVKKRYFPTRSDSVFSFDSVVYTLTTFEIDKVQSLSLPVYIIQRGDSIPVYAKADTIYLKEVIDEMPEEIALREDLVYREVDYPFNYPFLLIFIFLLSFIFLITYSIFGNKISKRIKIYRLKKDYRKFDKEFTFLIDQLRYKPINEKTEQTLIFWKGYLEKLENIPYKKFTSREIIRFTNNEQIKPALQIIDRKIYGDAYDNDVYQEFEKLKSFAKERYLQKTEELENV